MKFPLINNRVIFIVLSTGLMVLFALFISLSAEEATPKKILPLQLPQMKKAPPVKEPPVAMTADKERIIKTVRFLSEENFPRSANKVNKEKTINYLVQAFTKAGIQGTRQELTLDDRTETLTNVHALKTGKTDKRIIVAAHYDAVPQSPAADDNASGLAVLIELAYLLKETNELNCAVELVSYDAEETGYVGSLYHAKKLKSQKVDVACMLCMDLVGYYSEEKDSQDFPLAPLSLIYGTKGDFLGVIGRPQDVRLISKAKKAFQESVPLRVESITVPNFIEGHFSWSDHRNFWAEGYPALFFTDTAFYRNKNYHQKTDTWDTLDYNRLAQVPVGLYHLILAIDAANIQK